MSLGGVEQVVKEGWLLKRGEYIASWRPRYFLLKSDGSFRGYKNQPKPGDAPINFFDIVNSTLSLDDKSVKNGKYGFIIRYGRWATPKLLRFFFVLLS